jgi:hypothetical protein
VNELVLNSRPDQCLPVIYRLSGLLILFLSLFVTIRAQVSPHPISDEPYVVDGVSDNMAYGIGRSIKITGTVKNGAIALGGDVIVQGTVEGDVASIGGSVIQLEGGRIGGDVIVIGGAYRPYNHLSDQRSNRTIVYAGYEQELRGVFRNPTELIAPQWSPTYIGFRILAVLFWFVISLVLTAIMPTAISEGVTRLQLTTLRVAVISFFGAAIIGLGVPISLYILPRPVSAIIGLLAFFLIIGASIFGRVIIYAATGRWLQRKLLPVGKHSESVALLLGTSVWTALSSLPYIWPFVVVFIIVLSLGLSLTARYRPSWRRSQTV